jgi:hypothetical protein
MEEKMIGSALSPNRFKYTPLGVVLLSLLFCAGCGQKTGTLKGKVTLNGTPLPSGTVTVYGGKNDSITRNGEISSDGTYRIDKVPVGKVKITVSSAETPDLGQLGGAEVDVKDAKALNKPQQGGKKKAVPIPGKYGNNESSGLTAEVKSGEETTKDLELQGG